MTFIVDAGAFVGLFAVSALIRSRFRHHYYSATDAGAIVMATGIFTAFAFTQLPFYTPLLGRLETLEIFVIWLFLAWSYLQSGKNRHFLMHFVHPLRRFAIGTWVAGTAVLATLVTHTIPQALWFARVLTFIAVVIYLPYVVVFVRGYAQLWRQPLQQNANGVILLATVATQSVVIALHATFGRDFPQNVATAMAAFDMVFLPAGLTLIGLNIHALPTRLFATQWKNAYCIIHGALSITGLALVVTSEFSGNVVFGVWQVVLELFILVEIVELIRLFQRVHRFGLRRGIFSYKVTQWARNFTFGMFYAFSFELYRHFDALPAYEGDFWLPLLRFIVDWGQYVVLADFAVEAFILLRTRLRRFRARALA